MARPPGPRGARPPAGSRSSCCAPERSKLSRTVRTHHSSRLLQSRGLVGPLGVGHDNAYEWSSVVLGSERDNFEILRCCEARGHDENGTLTAIRRRADGCDVSDIERDRVDDLDGHGERDPPGPCRSRGIREQVRPGSAEVEGIASCARDGELLRSTRWTRRRPGRPASPGLPRMPEAP